MGGTIMDSINSQQIVQSGQKIIEQVSTVSEMVSETGQFSRMLMSNMNLSSQTEQVKLGSSQKVNETSKNFIKNMEQQKTSADLNPSKLAKTRNLDIKKDMQNVCDQLKSEICDTLDITEEQLEEALETLGMTMVDLFDQSNLTQLFLEVNGMEDMSALLTDENLASQLQSLILMADELNPLEEMGLTIEEANEIMSSFDEMLEDVSQLDETEKIETTSVETESVLEEESEVTTNVENVSSKENSSDIEDDNNASTEQKSSKQEKKEVTITVNGDGQVSTETKVTFMDQLAPTSQAKEIVDQIIQEIKVNVSTEKTSMEMVLTPETLGKVNLTVTSNHGVMTAHFVTETQAAKEAIESQLATLKQTFEDQGLKVEAVEVTVAADNFDFMRDDSSEMSQSQQESAQQSRSSHGNMQMNEDGDIEDESAKAVQSNINASIGKGTQIDLTA